MNGSRISIELSPEAPPDVIQLVAVAPCTLAATAVADGDGIRFTRLDAAELQDARTDAAMTIVVADAAPADAALADALRAVVSCVAASLVAMVTEDAQRFFLGAGRLALGRGEGADIATATRLNLLEQLRRGGDAIHRERSMVDLDLVASTTRRYQRCVSVLIGAPRSAIGNA